MCVVQEIEKMSSEPRSKKTKKPKLDNLETSKATITWAKTQSKVVGMEFNWVIEQFSLKPLEVGQSIRSPTFSFPTNCSTKWALEVNRKEQEEEEDEDKDFKYCSPHIGIALVLLPFIFKEIVNS